MPLAEDRVFRLRLERSENPYADVRSIQRQSKKILEKWDVPDSEAITDAIKGVSPGADAVRDPQQKREKKYLREWLCGVDDGQVRKAVIASVLSGTGRHAMYDYLGIEEPGRRARVRVLSRMARYYLRTLTPSAWM